MTFGILLVTVAVLTAGPSSAVSPNSSLPFEPEDLYRMLAEADVDGQSAYTISEVLIERQDATIQLRQGAVVYPLVAAGRQFGAVVLGPGLFRFEPEPRIEQDQLEKFSDERALSQTFDRLLLFFTDQTGADLLRGKTGPPERLRVKDARKYLTRRRKVHLEKLGLNFPARLLRDLVEGRHGYLFAEPKTDDHGTLTLELDPSSSESIWLGRRVSLFGGMLDTWCSYRPSGAGSRAAVRHYSIDVHLERSDAVSASVVAEVEPSTDGVRVLGFRLHPLMRVRSVTDSSGEALFFIREKSKGKNWERSLTVVLGDDLRCGERIRIEVDGEIIEDVDRREYGIKVTVGWYPELGYFERATYQLTFNTDLDHQLFASAVPEGSEVVGDRRISRWNQPFPVSNVAFNYGEMKTEDVVVNDGSRVTVFGQNQALFSGNTLERVGLDVAKSLAYFEEMFGEYPWERMYATRIPYPHGQGFPGLLHLAGGTFAQGYRGVEQAFRAHEVAHQWWGHLVGWKTYRDQWLSEGFAVYSGALYAERTLEDAELLERMLESWRNDVLGKGNLGRSLGMTHFGYPREAMKYSRGSKAGPISIGNRLGSSRSPMDYTLLVYEKGAWVLHMLRMLLYDYEAASDAQFRAIMSRFVAEYRWGNASTADFRAIVEDETGRDLHWFFQQWVHGTTIPKYSFAWRKRSRGGEELVEIRVEQELEDDRPFEMTIPIRFELADGSSLIRRVHVSGESSEETILVPAQVNEVHFNHGLAVLCESRTVRY